MIPFLSFFHRLLSSSSLISVTLLNDPAYQSLNRAFFVIFAPALDRLDMRIPLTSPLPLRALITESEDEIYAVAGQIVSAAGELDAHFGINSWGFTRISRLMYAVREF